MVFLALLKLIKAAANSDARRQEHSELPRRWKRFQHTVQQRANLGA
jgi:hypothetical protein